MKVLYVTGSCLQKNTSANMSHNSFLEGFLKNGISVDVIMAKDSFGVFDNSLPKFKEIMYYEFESVSKIDRLVKFIKTILKNRNNNVNNKVNITLENSILNNTKENYSYKLLRKIYRLFFRNNNIYQLEKKWLKTAKRFRSKEYYDFIISNSSPSASHALADKIRANLSYGKWIQIWEDPWYLDIYGRKDKRIYKEEKRLISLADYVFYVSPLTLKYQKELYCEFKNKMDVIPLPYFKTYDDTIPKELKFGYFGDYYSNTRNLRPFYNALIKTNSSGYIFGDSDLVLNSTSKITVNNRVTIDKLKEIQDNTSIYVSVCNLRGGQIPGKIYHYSASNKPIIFILDGTDEEIQIIYSYFKIYNRYYFCRNTVDDIVRVINEIEENSLSSKKKPVEDFSPKNVVKLLLMKVGVEY